MKFRSYRRRGRGLQGTKIGDLFEFVMFVIVIFLAPVMLIPFYMAAASIGAMASVVMLLVTLAIWGFGFVGIYRRWWPLYDRLMDDTPWFKRTH